ncbi:hypothetical protein FQZ97_899910 [compost metagenome]
MHGGVVQPTGDDLHGFLAAQCADVDAAGQREDIGREQPAVPGEQALGGERLLVIAGDVEQQFGQAFAAGAGFALGS